MTVAPELPTGNNLYKLGPGRPSAGGPRMDRRAVTSSGVVNTSRLASRLRRSARRGPDPTAVPQRRLVKKRDVTHAVPRRAWLKSVKLLTRCLEEPD